MRLSDLAMLEDFDSLAMILSGDFETYVTSSALDKKYAELEKHYEESTAYLHQADRVRQLTMELWDDTVRHRHDLPWQFSISEQEFNLRVPP